MSFKDNFSTQSGTYAKYRPSYPVELFVYLSSLTKEHNLAWDCATGNGQAAISLTNHYKKVFATDPSNNQIKNAVSNAQIEYKIEQAEKCSLKNASVDLITVAQALHWFDFNKFYVEAKRVLKPGGILASWAYGLPEISPPVDAVINYFHDEILGGYWLPENRLIDKGYNTIPFPFDVIETPRFIMTKSLTYTDVLGHIKTWSAVQKYVDEKGTTALEELEKKVIAAWGVDPVKEARWKLILRVGRSSGHNLTIPSQVYTVIKTHPELHNVSGIPLAKLHDVIPDEDYLHFDIPPFYTLNFHMQQNSYWKQPDAAIHEIDPNMAVLIGDFGPGTDTALTLDYRNNLNEPEVWRLKWRETNHEKNHWVKVAGSFKEFAIKTGLFTS